MKLSVFFMVMFWVVACTLRGQMQSERMNITPSSYIHGSVAGRMYQWLQKNTNESESEYQARVSSQANREAAQRQFEAEVTAKYKDLFLQSVNWRDMKIISYDDNKQAFLIQPVACAEFMMPIPREEAQGFWTEFQTLTKTDPDFYFEGDIVKFSKLTFINPTTGKTYVYDVNNTSNVINNPPVLAGIDWTLPLSQRSEVDKRDFNIQACVKSESPITSVSVSVNDQITRGISTVVNDGCDFAINQNVILNEGMNTIKIVVANEAGQSVSDIRYINYRSSKSFDSPNVGTQITGNKRLALVIGNSAYDTFPLANPVNDATDIAAKLKTLGFDVMLLTDKTRKQMEQAIYDFNNKAQNYDVAFFYYAGHAVQYNGKNYLIPVDADLREERDIEYECTIVDRVLSRMDNTGKKLKIVTLDACRNNPFERSWRSIGGKGLSFMDAPTGTFIAYSTAPNGVASDGTGRNSPYTTELLKKLDIKGLKIEDLYKQVREAVLKSTNGRQVPWDQSSIIGDFYFNY